MSPHAQTALAFLAGIAVAAATAAAVLIAAKLTD